MQIKLFLRAIRAPFLTASIIPVILGISFVWQQGTTLNWGNAILTVLGIICIHIGTNVINDYFDYKSGNDQVGPKPSPFSGGSRVIQEKLLKPSQVRNISLIAYALGIIIGLYLVGQTDLRLLYLGMGGVFIGIFYSANPLQLSYHGLGEIICGIGFGPLIVVGAYFVQTLEMPWVVWLISVPIGLLIAAVLLINEFTDYEADQAVSKKTIVVRWGIKKAGILYAIIVFLAYLIVCLAVFLYKLPSTLLLSLLTFPLAYQTMQIILNNKQNKTAKIKASAQTIQLHLFFGLLMIFGLILSKWI